MTKLLNALLLATLAGALVVHSEEPLSNRDIVSMTAAGLSDSLIIQKISASPTDFDVTTSALIDLKSSGVGDPVIAAMIRCQAAVAGPHTTAGVAPRQSEQATNLAKAPARVHEPSGVRLLTVPGGSFMIGCDGGSQACPPEEQPRKNVHIRTFLLAETEITNLQVSRCVQAGFCAAPGMNQPHRSAVLNPIRQNHPATDTVGGADTFCRWIGGRLPSESEWEYAASGGKSQVAFPWGNSPLNELLSPAANANLPGNPDDGYPAEFLVTGPGQKAPGTAPVASYEPNGWGLYDMVGNVAETVEDCWYDDYRGVPLDGSARNPKPKWKDRMRCLHVIRGGDWTSRSGEQLRIGARARWQPQYEFLYQVGFRCAVDP